MKDHALAWAEALAVLGYSDEQDDASQQAIRDIKNLERRPKVRQCPGFRLLELVTGGDTKGPLAWLLRYALGRAVADEIAPNRDPSFTFAAALSTLGELAGSALEVLAQRGPNGMIADLLFESSPGSWTADRILGRWLVHGSLAIPDSTPVTPPTRLVKEPIDELGGRIAGLVGEHAPPMFLLSGVDPMLAVAVAAAACSVRNRPLRCWAVRLGNGSVSQSIVALRWIGAIEGFDPMIIPRRYMLEARTGGDGTDPEQITGRPDGVTLWVGAPEEEPTACWLSTCRAAVDLTPLLPLVEATRPAEGSNRDRPRTYRPTHSSLHPSVRNREQDELPLTPYTSADRRARLDRFQRAAFPGAPALPPITTVEVNTQDDQVEPHTDPERWATPKRDLDHLVLGDQQRGSLQRAAARMKRGERCVILLHGPPGSGKTRAAHCLAGTAGLPVYEFLPHLIRDTLYGEQDRKVAEVFAALQRRPAVLVIDEADQWLGRREGSAAAVGGASVSECSALLQELERYEGAAVLTTNRLSAMDVALHRRTDLMLHLALPGLTERMALWASLLATHRELRADELCLLASVPLTGGDIAAIIREADLMHGDLSIARLLPVARQRARRASLLG